MAARIRAGTRAVRENLIADEPGRGARSSNHRQNGRRPRRTSMRKLIFSMTVSLDGYIAAPDGTIDWTAPSEELFRFHTDQVQATRGTSVRTAAVRNDALLGDRGGDSAGRGARRVRQDLEGAAEGRVLHDAGERGGQHEAGQQTASAMRSQGSRNRPARTSPSAARGSPMRA